MREDSTYFNTISKSIYLIMKNKKAYNSFELYAILFFLTLLIETLRNENLFSERQRG